MISSYQVGLAAAIDGAGSIQEWRYGKEPKLNIVLESGHDNAPDAMRLYNFFKDRVPSSALSGLTFESKGDSLPLAAADLFAYTSYLGEVGGKFLGVPKKPTKSSVSYRGNMSRIGIDRQTLDELHAQALAIANGTLLASRRPF